MITYLGKSCSFCLPRVPFVNCRQFMYLVIFFFGFEGRIWDLIVSVLDHCLSFYFVDLPEHHLKQEAIAQFCQGCCDKEASKQVCFEQPSTMEEALNLVKHHQYISQAVDGKRQRKGAEASVNAVQSTSEARVEQLIAFKGFASKMSKTSPTSTCSTQPQPVPTRTKQVVDKGKKNALKCFFLQKVWSHEKRL